MDSEGKANLISKTLASKCSLPTRENNVYSSLANNGCEQPDVPLPTIDMAYNELKSMREDSGTGPDELPARILKECAVQLSMPVAILVMRIIMLGVWPDMWRDHWIIPLF